ncbi:MAG: GTP cyclohydrolase I FolE [Lachnospiraceae bacterium]|nr:GTP cyclohydrolase I FolE [Lachnospiraceae bacterium]
MIDQEKIKEATKLFLEGIGEDINREGLKETPDRVARMCEELFAGFDMNEREILSKRFKVEGKEAVIEKDIPFYSVCEHHLLPFFGKIHIAYIPKGEVVGISKLARTVEVYARRPQIQERLTNEIADAIERELDPEGVMVYIEAEHMCMTMRGVKKPGSKTVTTAVRGAYEQESLRNGFYNIIK